MKYKLWFLRILFGTGIVLMIAQEGILWAESGAPAFHPKALVVLLSLLTALAATFYSKLNSPGRARLQGLWQSSPPSSGRNPAGPAGSFTGGCGPGWPGTGPPPATT